MPDGIHHVALFTADMDETVRFWTSVMRARLVRAGRDRDADPGTRQYYFDVGGSLLAFFEFPAKDREALQWGWMHHLSLRVRSRADLEEWRRHIEGYDVPVSTIQEHDFLHSVYLHDPNGIMVEISWPSRELTEDDLRKDPHPAPAVREILGE